MIRILGVMVLGLWLAGCGGRAAVDLPDLGYEGAPAVQLEAERPAEIIEDYRPPLRAPNVEHNYRIVPAQIARTWLRERVALSGSGGSVKLTIREASVVEEPLEVKGGFLGLFRREANRRLVATLDVTFDYVGVAGSGASATAQVQVIRTLQEGDDETEVERAYFEMLEDLSARFDTEMQKQLDRAFRPVFRRAA